MSLGLTAIQIALSEELLVDIARILGLTALAATVAAVVALAFRWYAREPISTGVSVLIGLGVVALYLNSKAALARVIEGDTTLLTVRMVVANSIAFVLGSGAGGVGGRIGDRLATDVFSFGGLTALDTDVSRLVRTVGRVVTVDLPDDPDQIEDIETYDPVAPEMKRELAGKSFVFPRQLTVEQLRDRLIDRLRKDYGVGYVDVDLAPDGGVEYIALGSRIAGLGPTLLPGSAAIAVQADPAYATGTGDVVQVWQTSPPEHVTTAEVRGVAGDVVTIATDATDIERLVPTETYRLVTLPDEPRPEQEYAALLRAADETLGATTVEPGALLDGTPVGALDVPVVAIRTVDGGVDPLPSRDRTVTAHETIYAVGRPDALRRLDAAAAGPTTTAS